VIVFIAQRSQSPGPLFHVQNRAGMQNRHASRPRRDIEAGPGL
jgi:lipopolysaccharide/colanic/teichoic acid biosynthesis glycosyltransferase